MDKVLAVIVTYNPDVYHLQKLLESLLHQVDAQIVIDNHSVGFQPEKLEALSPKIEVFVNKCNVGLATAYNQACSIAKERSYSHIILFDQDSLPSSNMVEALLAAMRKHNRHDLVVAVVGPKYCDVKGQLLSPFVRIKNYHLERVECALTDVVDVDHLISSGSLIDLRAVARVGNFVDELFIDYVDTEWCLRVKHHKLRILGVGNALMDHSIGEKNLKVLGRQIPMHTPLRLQYQFRNGIWVIKQPWVGWRWRIIDSVRCFKLTIVYVFFAPNKLNNLRAIAKGIVGGVTGKMGKIETK